MSGDKGREGKRERERERKAACRWREGKKDCERGGGEEKQQHIIMVSE